RLRKRSVLQRDRSTRQPCPAATSHRFEGGRSRRGSSAPSDCRRAAPARASFSRPRTKALSPVAFPLYSGPMDATARPKVTIYTDGACSANGTAQSRGGWAAILNRDSTSQSEELFGGEKPATNQRMEIRAVIEGLKTLKEPCQVTVYSDSAYVINCMKQRWFDGW